MPIKSEIVGLNHGLAAQVVCHPQYLSGLVSYTHPVESLRTKFLPAFNETYGVDMSQNGSTGGTPDGIHDGTDTALWTASALSGTWTFNSTDQAQAGTQSVDATSTTNNDEALFTRASTVDLSTYASISGYIYITAWPTVGTKDVRLRFRAGGIDDTSTIDLSSYTDTTLLNTWQAFNIPLSAFTIPNQIVDELVVTTIDIGGQPAPEYYLDNLQLEQTGSPVVFKIKPDVGERMVVHNLNITMVYPSDAITTVAGATENSPNFNLPYNTFGHLAALTNGMAYNRYRDGVIEASFIFRRHFDLYRLPTATVDSIFSDGTNTMIKWMFDFRHNPFELNSKRDDRIELTISDDLSGLLEFETFAGASITESYCEDRLDDD
jgi:hypothetical protein